MPEIESKLKRMGPYEVRLFKSSIKDMVDDSPPTTVIKYLDSLDNPELKSLGEEVVREYIEKDQEYLERFEKVREAMNTIKELNFPRFW